MRLKGRVAFSLRSLMAVVILIALAVAWLTERARQSRRIQADIIAAGGSAGYDMMLNRDERMRIMIGLALEEPKSFHRRLQRRYPEYFSDIWFVSLRGARLTPEARRGLSRLSRLRWLEVESSTFNDDDLAALTCDSSLNRVDGHQSQLTDRGARFLPQFQKLDTLDLRGTGITDAGLTHLSRMPNLRQLQIGQYIDGQGRVFGQLLSAKAIADLRAAIPYCSINGQEAPAIREANRRKDLESSQKNDEHSLLPPR